jgi:hypothetical protein
MTSLLRRAWVLFVVSITLALFAIVFALTVMILIDPPTPDAPSRDIERFKADWKAGRVLERVSLEVLGKPRCIEIVADERTGKGGFIAAEEDLTDGGRSGRAEITHAREIPTHRHGRREHLCLHPQAVRISPGSL